MSKMHVKMTVNGKEVEALAEPRTLLIIGLALISIGSGGIKPCVSAHVGDQFGGIG